MAVLSVGIKIPPTVGRLPEQVAAGTTAGLRRVAEHAHQIAVARAGAINDRPIPTREQVNAYNRKARRAARLGKRRPGKPKSIGGAGTPAWDRTGALLEAVEAEPVFANGSITLNADVAWAKARHDLGTPAWMPKKPALGIVRKDSFFADTKAQIEPQILPLFWDGFREGSKL